MLFGRGDFEIAAYADPENGIECGGRTSLSLSLVMERAYETITLFLCRHMSDVDCRCLGSADYIAGCAWAGGQRVNGRGGDRDRGYKLYPR